MPTIQEISDAWLDCGKNWQTFFDADVHLGKYPIHWDLPKTSDATMLPEERIFVIACTRTRYAVWMHDYLAGQDPSVVFRIHGDYRIREKIFIYIQCMNSYEMLPGHCRESTFYTSICAHGNTAEREMLDRISACGYLPWED